MKSFIVPAVLVLLVINFATCDKNKDHKKPHKNKYSEEANNMPTLEKYDPDFRNIQRPFRMAKLNLVWTKAQHRLTEPKLKSIFTELKIHDKEELAWKQLNSQHKDKDGLKEAELRKKLIGIMSTYGLLEHFDDTQDPEKYKHHKAYEGSVDDYINKSLFKDKKLNKLWEKAEMAGFNAEELKKLKEEFEHHQEKIDVYFNTLETITSEGKNFHHENAVNEDELDRFNEITNLEDDTNSESNDIRQSKHNEFTHRTNQLRDQHREIRDNYDRLKRISAKGPNSQEFIEPKVQGLWRVASSSDFTPDELASIKTELLHFESRLLKLRQMHVDHALSNEKHKNNQHGDKKHDRILELEDKIKKQSRKVEKIQEDIERKIFKHSEL